MSDDEDDEERYNQFEDGHWIWDPYEADLKFISHKVFVDEEDEPIAPVSDDITFRLDVDLLEQVVFKKKFFRKVKEGQPDVVTIQDIKDVVLFTAPKGNLNFNLINTLHTQSYERFVRALIVYTQYYIQVHQIMKQRMADGAKKIRLPQSDVIERELEHNLADLRSLVARDLLYLHLDDGAPKLRMNLIGVEMRYTEMLIRISIQIVWIALLRPKFDFIEPELNRILRSESYNLSTHKESYEMPVMTPYDKAVFYRQRPGDIVERDKFKKMTPGATDLLKFPQDYRHAGVGVMGFERDIDNLRIDYLDEIFCLKEEFLSQENIRIGILGEPRNKFDVMLVEIVATTKGGGGSKSHTSISPSKMSTTSKKSKWSLALSGTFDIPQVSDSYELPPSFPELPPVRLLRAINKKQRIRWLKYIKPRKKK